MVRSAELVLQTALPELPRLANWVASFARDAQLTADTVATLQLCLEEAVANIVMHGGMRAEVPIMVSLTPVDGEIVVVIEDEAHPFDPTALPQVDVPNSLEEAPIGELGVHLIRVFVSEMQYERCDGRNRLTLRIAIPQAGLSPT